MIIKLAIYEDMTEQEKKVAYFLRDIGVWWMYEQPIYVLDDKERPRIWTPDFYLPELGIYIEVCGTKNKKYSYRRRIYTKNRIPIIFIHTYKKREWRDYLIKEIKHIQRERELLISNISY